MLSKLRSKQSSNHRQRTQTSFYVLTEIDNTRKQGANIPWSEIIETIKS